MIGFFVGRFQPFHNAHLKIIKDALSQVDKLIIGVGSSQYSDTAENPFTFEERKEMILLALQEANISKDKYEIIAIPDIHQHDKWVEHVESICPKLDVIFTHNDFTQKLFKEKNYKVVFVERIADHSATEVRKKIKNGEPWEDLVPKAVSGYIHLMAGVKRIKEL